MIKIIRHLLSSNRADVIESDLLGSYFDWYWNDTSLGYNEIEKFKTKNSVETGQFVHKLFFNYDNENTRSIMYNGFSKVFNKVNYEKVIRIKCNLNINHASFKKTSHLPIHQDNTSKNYMSLIYYINDSDGDTIFFNKKLKEIKRVKPKKNTAILFDSNILHCGCNPIKSSTRGVINFIFKGNEKNILYR